MSKQQAERGGAGRRNAPAPKTPSNSFLGTHCVPAPGEAFLSPKCSRGCLGMTQHSLPLPLSQGWVNVFLSDKVL